MTRSVAYLRVSLDKQAERGISLDVQRERVTAYADLYGMDLVEIIEEAGVSARSLDRPGLARALDLLAAGRAEALLVAKLDRLTRSVRDLDDLVKLHFTQGTALVSVSEQVNTQTAAGRLVLNLISSVSQWEREALGERTSAALRHKRAKGEYTGGHVPFGFDLAVDGINLIPNDDEQAVISHAQKARLRGWSLRRIGQDLATSGHHPRRGGDWDAKQVSRLLAAAAQNRPNDWAGPLRDQQPAHRNRVENRNTPSNGV